MTKTLIPLDEYNKNQSKRHENDFKPRPSGIKCPRCGQELLEKTDIMLLSCPPQAQLFCRKCTYVASKLL